MWTHFDRRGLTLIELLVVVVIIGILATFATPRIRRAMLRNEVISARNAMANLYTTGRLNATQTNRRVVFKRSGNVVWLEAWPRLTPLTGSSRDTLGQVVDLSDRHGVTVNVTGADSVAIDPKGLGSNSVTWRVRRAEFIDSIRVSSYGVILR